MAYKNKGPRSGTRYKFQKKIRGMPKVNNMMKTFNIGDKVVVKPDSGVHIGLPYHRFQGNIGSIIGKRGRSYLVSIKDGKKLKTLISHPVHLKKVL